MNSRYNALLIAREDLDVAQEHLVKNYRENYEQELPVFRPIDSTRLDTAKLFLVDAIKKASIIAEKHSNSKYLDEAYLLIGEARIYKGEFENAIETYKYLNTVAASEDKKTMSMVQMLRTYIEIGDKKNAEQLVGLLRPDPSLLPPRSGRNSLNGSIFRRSSALFKERRGKSALPLSSGSAVRNLRGGDAGTEEL